MRDFERPGRSLAMSTQGMAATSHPLSTLVAVNMLQSGGNAVDAAIAACAVQCVVEPGSTGIGGDCFALLAEGGGDNVIAFNGSGRTPNAANQSWYASQGIAALDRQSPHSVTVPGAIDAWEQLLRDHGTRGLDHVLQPAIRLSEDGYAITPRVSLDWQSQVDLLRSSEAAKSLLLVDGQSPRVGSKHRQPKLAATLRGIAKYGRDFFYKGPVAQDIVETLQKLGGLHTLEDFAKACGEYVTPIRTNYCGSDIFECPPNSQGVTALLMLNILGESRSGDPLSLERVHRQIEASRLAYAARDAYVADPALANVPVNRLLSSDYAREMRERIKPGRMCDIHPAPSTTPHRDTVYLCVVDKDRTTVSFINSIFSTFGSGIVAPRSGVLLHNRGMSFSLDPGHPNVIVPNKRPMHTIIPGMALRDGKVEMPFGVMGGHYQAMGHAWFLSNVLGYGLDMQEAMDLPRFFPEPDTGAVEFEGALPTDVQDQLRKMGYSLKRANRPIGGSQAIRIDWKGGVLIGASDPRKDGCALGY